MNSTPCPYKAGRPGPREQGALPRGIVIPAPEAPWGKYMARDPGGAVGKKKVCAQLSNSRLCPTAIFMHYISFKKHYQSKSRTEIALPSIGTHLGKCVN